MDTKHNQPLHQRMLVLPDDLRAAVAATLAGVSSVRWVRAAQDLSERYRTPRADGAGPLASGDQQALGYAALILPAAYAQLRGAMAATAVRVPGWRPTTLLDLGSGPGTALWAAAAQWPSLDAMTAWEREGAFIKLGRALARDCSVPAVRAARWEQVDLQQIEGRSVQSYDLVVLGHVLNELDPATRVAVVAAAWRRTAGVLLIVEPGTSAAFPIVRVARDQLLQAGAATIAPCAHDQPCPLMDDWCHFPQRLKRPDFQRRARAAPSEWEDSKFSYAAMARFLPERPIWGRVIRGVTSNKAYAETTISARPGIIRYRALKRYKEAFRRARAISWGDALDQPPESDE